MNPFEGLAVPLVSRPGDRIRDPKPGRKAGREAGRKTALPRKSILGLHMNAFEWLLCALAWCVIGAWTARKLGVRFAGFWSKVWTR
jgi:hypothetical protein